MQYFLRGHIAMNVMVSYRMGAGTNLHLRNDLQVVILSSVVAIRQAD